MGTIEQLRDDAGLRRFEYEDSTVMAADFGPGRDVTVDVVGETVMVVHDGEQYDLEVSGDARAFIKNGVLTIEIDE
jgi:hypothetical protein